MLISLVVYYITPISSNIRNIRYCGLYWILVKKSWGQHHIKQVGLTIHFKAFLVRNSDNIKYETQKPCNENQSLKSTDLRQTQRFIESSSISTALVPYSFRFSQVHWYYNNNIISKLYCTYRNYVVIPREKKQKQTHTHTQNNNNKTSKNSVNI